MKQLKRFCLSILAVFLALTLLPEVSNAQRLQPGQISTLERKTNAQRNDSLMVPIVQRNGSKIYRSYVADLAPYKVYTALISQSSTSAPTAVVLQNTLGATPTFTRSATGTYNLILPSGFTDSTKVFSLGSTASDGTAVPIILAPLRVHSDTIRLKSSQGGTLADGKLTLTPLEIRVYKP